MHQRTCLAVAGDAFLYKARSSKDLNEPKIQLRLLISILVR